MKIFPFRCKTCGKEATLDIAPNCYLERKGIPYIEFSVEGEVKVSRKLIFKDDIVVSENCWMCENKK